MSQYILVIDQGTTSSRAMLFDLKGNTLSKHQLEFKQFYPKPGWVEHDPEEIWATVKECCHQVLKQSGLVATQINAIGITNQRETTVIWDRKSGKPIYNAIVWQDRRTADHCQVLKNQAAVVQAKTGLLIDPYFSATKIAWILDHVPQARHQAEMGQLAFGTIDSFLLWRLTNGGVHATDVTNAARTMLFNIHNLNWDKELLELFKIPAQLLPQILNNTDHFGEAHLLGATIPITAMAGDQQAALFGQTCFEPGMVKSTYGTGCFMMLNTGEEIIQSKNQLLTTIAYRLSDNKTHYALEGSIFSAGSAVKWLRDNLGLIQSSRETEPLAQSLSDNGGVYCVPAFTGLGAPYWDANARGAIFGLTHNTRPAHIVRAVLEAIAYQTRDLITAMIKDSGIKPTSMRVDGGMVANNWLMQFLADTLQIKVERAAVTETTALGTAFLAGLGAGLYKSPTEIKKLWRSDHDFHCNMSPQQVEQLYHAWLHYVLAAGSGLKL